MEDQDKRTEEQEDVEAHRNRHAASAAEDAPKDEGEGDDFELHGRHHNAPLANEDAPKAEGEDEGDDFELHRFGHRAL